MMGLLEEWGIVGAVEAAVFFGGVAGVLGSLVALASPERGWAMSARRARGERAWGSFRFFLFRFLGFRAFGFTFTTTTTTTTTNAPRKSAKINIQAAVKNSKFIFNIFNIFNIVRGVALVLCATLFALLVFSFWVLLAFLLLFFWCSIARIQEHREHRTPEEQGRTQNSQNT